MALTERQVIKAAVAVALRDGEVVDHDAVVLILLDGFRKHFTLDEAALFCEIDDAVRAYAPAA